VIGGIVEHAVGGCPQAVTFDNLERCKVRVRLEAALHRGATNRGALPADGLEQVPGLRDARSFQAPIDPVAGKAAAERAQVLNRPGPPLSFEGALRRTRHRVGEHSDGYGGEFDARAGTQGLCRGLKAGEVRAIRRAHQQ
jgi:hypothetical protein